MHTLKVSEQMACGQPAADGQGGAPVTTGLELIRRHGVLCFGGEDWWYHNRGHCDMQLMRCYARRTTVLYVNSIVMRKPNVTEGKMFLRRVRRKLRSISRGLTLTNDHFWVYSPVTAPVHHLSGARLLNEVVLRAQIRLAMRRAGLRKPLVWVNCPVACETALALRRSALVYQRTDRYEDFPGVDGEQVAFYDRRLKGHADLTFYSNHRLYEQERHQCRHATYVEHGVDFDRFASAAHDPWVPPELRDLPRPIIGFFGGIDEHTFDLELMSAVVEQLPDLTFVFVGNASIDCSTLQARPNVRMVPQRPYQQIPRYGKCFDVCIMPWRQNRWIEACNPIKLKEYLALGKPIVSTPFPELKTYDDLIHVARSPTDFAACVRKALDESDSTLRERRQDHVRPSSWEAKANQILETLWANRDRM